MSEFLARFNIRILKFYGFLFAQFHSTIKKLNLIDNFRMIYEISRDLWYHENINYFVRYMFLDKGRLISGQWDGSLFLV